MVMGAAGRKAKSSSSSKKVTRHYSSFTSSGRRVSHRETLTTPHIHKRKAQEAHEGALRRDALSNAERAELDAIRDAVQNDRDNDGEDDEWVFESILTGEEQLEISHEGGEFGNLADSLQGKSGANEGRRYARDYRTRRDRVQRRTQAFAAQMPALVDAYMDWSARVGAEGMGNAHETSGDDMAEAWSNIRQVDLYHSRTVAFSQLVGDSSIISAIVRQGMIPCAPYSPSAALTTRTLEAFRILHHRCPRLSIHSFVNALCDIHSVPFQPYLSRQFSIAFDVYLSILAGVRDRVDAALERNSPDYRLRNCCPACTYKLEDEPKLKFAMLYTVDGNDSLKRVIRREEVDPSAAGGATLGACSESVDDRQVGAGMYLTREQVDMWATEVLQQQIPDFKEDDDENPCSERWRNMKAELTKRMWGVFDETGLFLALCRHGFVLLLADMVKSGELSKYPLAIVDKLLSTFGKDLALGYDIGCRFGATLKKSPLGPRIRAQNHSTLVGAFHGHAHNRLCQSQYLATYVKGLGLEHLEGCEQFFSRSNELAGVVRYSSVFHRRQSILTYCEHTDSFETYQRLSAFLLNNYKRAVETLATKPQVMASLERMGAETPGAVEGWLLEERQYLKGLSKEPLEETLEMEYYTALLVHRELERDFANANALFHNLTPQTVGHRDNTQAIESKRRHTMEKEVKALDKVQSLETSLSIRIRWEPGCLEWSRTAEKVRMRTYQRCLDQLEGLVVARMFELTKMNQSRTGYSLRKHIANALKARSVAIRAALVKYNAAAAALEPPRPPLDWDEIVEYAFLADFDLLRDARQDVRLKPWANPAARLAMDMYFKTLRAEEEIERLNVEIRRLATFIRDEDEYLRRKELELQDANPHLAHAIALRRMERGRYDALHRENLQKMYALQGFTGNPSLGTRRPTLQATTASVPMPPVTQPAEVDLPLAADNGMDTYDEGGEDELDDEQVGEDEDALVFDALCSVFDMATVNDVPVE